MRETVGRWLLIWYPLSCKAVCFAGGPADKFDREAFEAFLKSMEVSPDEVLTKASKNQSKPSKPDTPTEPSKDEAKKESNQKKNTDETKKELKAKQETAPEK